MSITSRLVDLAVHALEGGAEREGAQVAQKVVRKAAPLAVARKSVPAPSIIKRVSGAEKRAPSSARYSREELARRYPEQAPPVLKVDKKSGKEFLSKGESPEAAALKLERMRVASVMGDEGYTPYFDPNERYYVNPTDYPLEGNTLSIKPAKEATSAKYEAAANEPGALSRLSDAYARGAEHPGARRWYAMGQLEDMFKNTLGPQEGRAKFKERFADAMAATTGGMDPEINFRLAQYMNFLREHGLSTPTASHDLPYPIGGGKYGVMPNVAQYDRLINDGEGLSIANPKRFNFSANFLGHTDRSTLDEQMMSAWNPKLASPPSNSYGIYEGALGDLARQLRAPAPAEAQDVMWAGIKLPKEPSYVPSPMISVVNDAIERTSRLTGTSPDDVVEHAITRSRRPTYRRGGSVKSLAAR